MTSNLQILDRVKLSILIDYLMILKKYDTSWRKQDDMPAYLIGKSASPIHSFR